MPCPMEEDHAPLANSTVTKGVRLKGGCWIPSREEILTRSHQFAWVSLWRYGHTKGSGKEMLKNLKVVGKTKY